MKRVAFVVVFSFFLLTWPGANPQAACQIGPGKTESVQVTFHGDKENGSSIKVNDVVRYREPAQCTNPAPSGPYTISCDDETTEIFGADSVFAPLCGSSPERGKANSTCYQCGSGVIKCDGFNWTLGESSNMFNTHERCPFDKDNPNWSGDVWCSPPDAKALVDKKFIYNGKEYNYNGEMIVACGSNNQACGASEACTNLAHSDINNRGSSTERLSGSAQSAQQQTAPPTVIDGRPGRTTFTMNTSQTITLGSAIASFWETVINWVFHFPVIDGRVKTTESDLTRQMNTVLGTLDGRYNGDGALTGSQQGGKLLPLALQQTLSWPQEKATDLTNYVKEWYVGRDCGWLGNNVDLEGKVNPDMAVTQNLTDSYPTTLGGFVIWDALLGPHKTNGQPGIPSTNMEIDPGPPIGFVDESSGKTKLNESFLEEVYRCQSQSPRRQTTRRFFDIFGFLGFGESEGSGWNVNLPVDPGSIFECGDDENILYCIAFHKVKTFTQWFNGQPAMTSAMAGMEKDERPEGVAPDLVEKLRNDYAGAGNTFLPQVKIDESKVRYYNRLGHSSTTLEGASSPTFGGRVNPKLPHHAVKRTIDRFTEMTCMITPLMLQGTSTFFPNGECDEIFNFFMNIAGELNPNTSDWALPGVSTTPISTSVSIDNTDVKTAIANATKDRIPACVLEAVKYVESGSDWSPPSECKINACSAAGPFQITVGIDNKGSNKCEQCGDSYADGSRTCPDAWPHDWPGNPDQSPCNVALAANGAVNLLITKSQYWTEDKGVGHTLDSSDPRTQQPGIILAGNSYYGSSAPIGRLENCSYGEFVYKNCDPSYVCGSGGNIDF